MKVNFFFLLVVLSFCAKTKLEYTAGVQVSTDLNYFDSAAGYTDSDVISISLSY